MQAQWLSISAIALSALLIAACGSDDNSDQARAKQMEQYAAKHGLDIDVGLDRKNGEEQIVIKQDTPGGFQGQIGSNLDLPDDFPSDVPVYPGLKIHAVNKIPNGHMLNAQSKDGIGKLADFYTAKMASQGWTASSDRQPAPTMRQLGYKKGTRIASVTLISGQNSPTTVQLGVTDVPQ